MERKGLLWSELLCELGEGKQKKKQERRLFLPREVGDLAHITQLLRDKAGATAPTF